MDLTGESLDEVFVHDAVRGGEEGEDVGDKVPFVIVELVVPVVKIF